MAVMAAHLAGMTLCSRPGGYLRPDSMHEPTRIDTSFDFRTDTPSGRDPDCDSPTLRQYHKFLWSKPLPDGRPFYLSDATPGVYLYHHSEPFGEFRLSSDTLINTMSNWKALKHIVIPREEREDFHRKQYTIGGMIVFPGNRIDGKQTINGARGCNRKIADRFDLTLECVRRHYLCQSSPLGETLSRYQEFFALFESFRGYVDFFLLNDLVTSDCSAVKFIMPFDDFNTSAVPMDRNAYQDYRRRCIEFIQARNRRIDRFCAR